MFDSGNAQVQVRSRLSGFPRDIGWYLGFNRSHIRNARGARILVYHGICREDHLRFNTLFIRSQTFESQLKLYKEYFNLISLDDFYQRRFNKERFNICITFDDGFANNHQYVLPLLEKYQVPATFFITGIRDSGYDILWNDVLSIAHNYGPAKFSFRNEEFVKGRDRKYISASTGKRLVDILRSMGSEEKMEMMKFLEPCKNKAPRDYWLQMNQKEIQTLSASNWVTIGSHSYFHNDLARISVTSVKEDMSRSKQFLEKLTGKEVKSLAFPYGSYSREVAGEAKSAGFSQLLAAEFLFPDDSNDATLRERLTINPFISNINQLHATITGNYK